MLMQPLFHFLFDIAAMATSMHLGQDHVRAILTDPRTATPIVRGRIASEANGWTLQPGPGGENQLRGPDGIWTVKTISAKIDFRPSAQIGKGRTTDPAGVANYWGGIAGYMLVDPSQLPTIQVYRVPIAAVAAWWPDPASNNFRIGRATLMQRLQALP